MHIEHRPGADTPHADALSREATETPARYAAADEADGEEDGGRQESGEGDVRLQDSSLQAGTREDSNLQLVKACLESGDEPPDDASPEVGFYLRDREYLSVKDSLILRQTDESKGPQILVPTALREELIRLAHDIPLSLHFGVERTLANQLHTISG